MSRGGESRGKIEHAKQCGHYGDRGTYQCFYNEKLLKAWIKEWRGGRQEHVIREERKERRQRHRKSRTGKKNSRTVQTTK